MLPLQTLPPLGDPSGGVVYLWTVFSPEQASHLWMFLNNVFYREGLLAPRPTPKLEDPPRRLSATAYSIYSQLLSLSDVVPLSATWGRAMPWWQGPTNTARHCQYTMKSKSLLPTACPYSEPDWSILYPLKLFSKFLPSMSPHVFCSFLLLAPSERKGYNFDFRIFCMDVKLYPSH